MTVRSRDEPVRAGGTLITGVGMVARFILLPLTEGLLSHRGSAGGGWGKGLSSSLIAPPPVVMWVLHPLACPAGGGDPCLRQAGDEPALW